MKSTKNEVILYCNYIRSNFQYGELILNNLLSVIGGTGCGLETYLTLSFFLPLYMVEY